MYNLPESEYDAFFNSLRLFVIRLGLLKDEDVVGATLQEITDFEKEYNIAFDKSIKSYLKYFGKNTGVGNFTYTLKSMVNSSTLAAKQSSKESIRKVREIEGWQVKMDDFSTLDFIFLYFYGAGGVHTFVKEQVENPILYYYWGDDDITTDPYTFTNTIRWNFFCKIYYVLKGIVKSPNSKIDNVPWMKFYKHMYTSNTNNHIVTWRYEFSPKISKIEAKEKRLLGIDEFEVEFIKFIIEEKKVDYLLSGFDPYQPLITFEDYLIDLNPKEDFHKEKIKKFFDKFCDFKNSKLLC